MKSTINKLPTDLINKIAAGEVVQRPSSVVKELIENSVDAGSTRIKLFIKDNGKTLIEISDNGIGMNEKDLGMCFLKHTTSKINKSSDLFSLSTKGFRGEAMSSISSISKILISSSVDNNGVRNVLNIENGKIIKKTQESGLKGTRISVASLFYNVPARRKFLKSDNVELRHIISEFTRQSLCHPEVSFTLKHNNKDVFVLNESNLKERILRLFSKNIDKKLVPINEQTDIASISGYVFKPEFLNKTRSMQFFFVNDRYVKNSYLNHSIFTAYDGLINPENKPSYILFLKIPSETIDVNVHPNKTEIKFENESSLYAILRSAVRHALGKFNISPNIDFSNDINISSPVLSEIPNKPLVDFSSDYNPFLNSKKNEVFKVDENISNHEEIINSSIQMFNDQEITDSFTYSNFSFLNKFIITKTKSELLIVDIKRACQRVLYERVLKEMNNKKNVSQTLLFPVVLNLDTSEFKVLKTLRETLQHLGFIFDKFSNNQIEISAIHPVFNHDDIGAFFNEMIENEILEYKKHSSSINDYLAKLICKSESINLKHLSNDKEQVLLLNQLFACKDPKFTPYMKKTFISIENNDILKRFNK